MKLEDCIPRFRVSYVPLHAHGNTKHADVAHGTISSKNTRFVFVKFDKQLAQFGWDGTTAQACDPADLIPSCEHTAAPLGDPSEYDPKKGFLNEDALKFWSEAFAGLKTDA